MPNIITVKIDVTKIEKERLFPGKKGAKYLDAVLIPTSNSRYGDTHVVLQSISKEERAQGKKGAIIGNAKDLSANQQEQRRAPSRQEQPEDDIAF